MDELQTKAPSIDAEPTVREKVEANGHLPIGTVDGILEKGPSDRAEKLIDVPEWECSVKIRTLTAFERSRIRAVGMQRIDSAVAWGEMEVQQFMAAVVEPTFSEHQVRKLYNSSGAGFARVIDAHDELSSMSKEELAAARAEFPQQTE